jgi:hypothetical protein
MKVNFRIILEHPLSKSKVEICTSNPSFEEQLNVLVSNFLHLGRNSY